MFCPAWRHDEPHNPLVAFGPLAGKNAMGCGAVMAALRGRRQNPTPFSHICRSDRYAGMGTRDRGGTSMIGGTFARRAATGCFRRSRRGGRGAAVTEGAAAVAKFLISARTPSEGRVLVGLQVLAPTEREWRGRAGSRPCLGSHVAPGFDSQRPSAPRAGTTLPVTLELRGDGFLAGWGNRETGTADTTSKNEQHPPVDACRAARITPAAANTFRSN